MSGGSREKRFSGAGDGFAMLLQSARGRSDWIPKIAHGEHERSLLLGADELQIYSAKSTRAEPERRVDQHPSDGSEPAVERHSGRAVPSRKTENRTFSRDISPRRAARVRNIPGTLDDPRPPPGLSFAPLKSWRHQDRYRE